MYNFAHIGDNVFIGGLLGDDFKVINNKIGILKNIYAFTSDNTIKYLANIKIKQYEFPIDMRYVYDLKNSSTDPIFLSNDVVSELYQYHDVKSAHIGVEDKTGNRVALCKTSLGSGIMLVISTLN